FFQAEDGIRDLIVTGVQTCTLPISADLAVRVHQHESRRVFQAAIHSVQLECGQAEFVEARDLAGQECPARRVGLEVARIFEEHRSEERRVGKECRTRWSTKLGKKKG